MHGAEREYINAWSGEGVYYSIEKRGRILIHGEEREYKLMHGVEREYINAWSRVGVY